MTAFPTQIINLSYATLQISMITLLFPGVSTLKGEIFPFEKAKGATIRDSQEKNIQMLINKKKFLRIFTLTKCLGACNF